MRPRPRLVAAAAAVSLAMSCTGDAPDPPRAAPSSPPPSAVEPLVVGSAVHGRRLGFYSAGLRHNDCYGSCPPGTEAAAEQERTRARMAELRDLGVTFVIESGTVAADFARAPAAFRAFLEDLRAHGIQAAYSVVSGPERWFPGGRFSTEGADEVFARTDLDGDGVSDLDGLLGALYQGHEVLEWATHEHRREIYATAKRWFPTTPVLVYYAAFTLPFADDADRRLHPGGPGGTWSEYAYGTGEADIALVGIRRSGNLTAADAARTRDRSVDARRLAEAARTVVRLVGERTPDVPVWVSTSFAGDDVQRSDPRAMWTPDEIETWATGLASVPEVGGLFLRSFGRFRYDLAHPDFGPQRAAFAAAAQALTQPP